MSGAWLFAGFVAVMLGANLPVLIGKERREFTARVDRLGREGAINETIFYSIVGIVVCGGIMLFGWLALRSGLDGTPPGFLLGLFTLLVPVLGIGYLGVRLVVFLAIKAVGRDRG